MLSLKLGSGPSSCMYSSWGSSRKAMSATLVGRGVHTAWRQPRSMEQLNCGGSCLAGAGRGGRRGAGGQRRTGLAGRGGGRGRGLRREGRPVDVAGDGAVALDKALVNAYDVVVLDRNLPLVPGDVVCQHVAPT